MSRFIDPSTLDIYDRLSRSSISHHEIEHEHEYEQEQGRAHHCDVSPSPGYRASVTPDGKLVEAETRSSSAASSSDSHRLPMLSTDVGKRPPSPAPQEPVPLRDPRWCGLVVHNIVVGVMSTVLPLTVFPFLMAYLNLEGTQALSARALLAAPWALRPLLVMVTDGVPLTPQNHRRPYLVLGWGICALALGTAYFFTIPDPFFRDRELVGTPLSAMTEKQLSTVNMDAPSHGAIYVMFMTVATMGYLLADVAADALMQELALTHFPIPREGTDSAFVAALTKMRLTFMLLSFLFMGIGMSGTDYGGDFGFTLDFNTLMLLMGILSLAPIPVAWTMIAESDTRARRSLRTGFSEIWKLMENRAINYVLACRFISGILSGISATAVTPIAFYWAHVQPLNDNVVSFVATGFVLGVLRYADKRGWTINFRLTIILANVIVLVADSGPTLFTIWNVVRTQWFWIGLPVMEALPSALDYVIVTILMSELADPGTEQTMRGLVPAVSFVGGQFGLAITKYVDAQFSVSNQDLMRDTTHVRVHATLVFMIAYVCQLLSLVWLLALPRHTNDAREWKLRSGSSRSLAAALLAVMLLAGAWGVAVHILSVNESTWCLHLAGGVGCGDD